MTGRIICGTPTTARTWHTSTGTTTAGTRTGTGSTTTGTTTTGCSAASLFTLPSFGREFTFETTADFLSNRRASVRWTKVFERAESILRYLFLSLPKESPQKILDCLICDLSEVKNLIYLRVLCIARLRQVLKYL